MDTPVIVFLPQGTSVEELAAAGFSPGLMSAGLGEVPAAQTYYDISQGNRVFDSLYDEDLPAEIEAAADRVALEVCDPAVPVAVTERAESAPADIKPGLLGRTLLGWGAEGCRVRRGSLREAARLRDELTPGDLLIAIESPAPADGEALAIGIAGRHFDGNLTSDSTRLDGYVLSTDVAPTILERLQLPVPEEMSGQPIRSEGKVDAGAVESLGDRMAAIPERRGPVIGLSLLTWLVALGLVVAVGWRRGADPVRRRRVGAAVKVVALSVVLLPLVLLLGGALEPSSTAELLLTAAGAPVLALLLLRGFAGLKALAVASALTVFACALDVIAGSPLTSLSLLGPNPGLGVRFYGIGNELEALLSVLVVAGTGAWLAGFSRHLDPGSAAGAFLGAGLLAAFVFAFGAFGADVGAAIVLPLGAAVAAAAVTGGRSRSVLLVLFVPVAALALVALLDLVSGADAHLTRSVLDAGGLDQIADVAERRLELSARSFSRPIVYVFMPLVAVAAAIAFIGRHTVSAWLDEAPALRAGMFGALAAVLVGALANDSGALVIEIGAAYLLAFLGFVWADREPVTRSLPKTD
jgi:hypothetical protein